MNVQDANIILDGHYVIVQRQKFRKICHFRRLSPVVNLSKGVEIDLSEILNKLYYSTFKLIPQDSKKVRSFTVEYVPSTILSLETGVEIKSCGVDNRNIVDDGKSQKLTSDEITSLRGSKSSTDILETLITNSNSFTLKTEYSQEKYVRKKEKKYFEYIQILKPSIRYLVEIMYCQNPGNILGMRIDTLSQLLSYSNVQSTGTFLLYESGTNGLLPSAIVSAMGLGKDAALIHLHPGTQCQEKGLLMMNYTKEQLEKCKSINVHSALRYFYQDYKNPKIMDEIGESEKLHNSVVQIVSDDKLVEDIPCKRRKLDENDLHNVRAEKKLKLKDLKEEVCGLLENKVDSLIMAVKEHPLSVFKSLMTFVKPGRPFVIYSSLIEPLQDTCFALSHRKDITNVHLFSNWMRGYQVLPERTHPNIHMSSNGGFILTGFILEDNNISNKTLTET